MKRIGLIILSLVLAVNLCVRFSGVRADNEDNIVYKITPDGQFQYLVDTSVVPGHKNTFITKYLGNKTEITTPEAIEGHDYNIAREFYETLSNVTHITFNEGIHSGTARYMALAKKLKKIELGTKINSKYWVYDNCLYGPSYVFGEEKDDYIALEDQIQGIPGGLEKIKFSPKGVIDAGAEVSYYEVFTFTSKLKEIIFPESSDYAMKDGSIVYKLADGELNYIRVLPANIADQRFSFPSGVKTGMIDKYVNYKELVFPEGFERFYSDQNYESNECESLYFPSTLNYISGYEGFAPETYDISGPSSFKWIDSKEKNIKNVYIKTTYKDAQERIKVEDKDIGEDPTYDSTQRVVANTFDAFCKKYFPNAVLHYANAIKIDDQINYGTITVSSATEFGGNSVTLTLKADDGYQLKKLTVTDKNGKKVEVKDNKFVMPDSDVTINAEFEKNSSGNQDSENRDDKNDEDKEDKTSEAVTYSDVPTSGKWYSEAVYYATAKGYMAGTGNNKFSPDATVTRGTIAQILYAAEGKPAISGKSQFTDVGETKWYAKAVKWAADKGLVSGYGNGKFGPEDRITREQMVAIMMQYSKMKGYDTTAIADLSKFRDQNKISKWAVNAVKWGVSHKIVSGTDKGIEPKGNATRAQIAVILQAYDKNLRK